MESRYSSTVHARPTSNLCERLFSQLKIIFNDHRHRMDPSTFEAILFLKYNIGFWDIHLIAQLLGCTLIMDAEDDNEEIDPFNF